MWDGQRLLTLLTLQMEGSMDTEHHTWVPACGGTERPFQNKIGHTMLYMWCPATGEHMYYDSTDDIFYHNSEGN